MKNIIFLVSGNGGTLNYCIKNIKEFQLPIKITNVVADRPCGAIELAKRHNLNYKVINRKQDLWLDLNRLLKSSKVDLVITTFHKIIPKSTLEILPDKFLNLHYSLLPSFKGMIGMKTVDKAKEFKCQIIGATAHIIDENIDEGRIVCQGAFSPNWLLEIEQLYHEMFLIACNVFMNAVLIELDINVELETSTNINNPLYAPALNFKKKS